LNLQSALVLPIEVGGRRLGAMQLGTQRPRKRRFTADEGELALAMANQAAVAIENARLFVSEQRRAEQFKVISKVGRRITSILDTDELMEQMAGLIQKTFNYYHVGFGLIEGDYVVSKAGAGPLWNPYKPLRLKVGEEGIAGWVAHRGEPLLVPNVSQEPRYHNVPEAIGTCAELCVPLKTKDSVIGVLDVQSDHKGAFDESDVAVLQSLADQAAIAIQNARLYERAQQMAVVEERNRLARDLHDAVTQTLFSASLIAETLPALWENDQSEGRSLLRELRQLSRGAMAEMRTLLLELRPATLVDANLGDLLHQLAEAVTGRIGIPVQVIVQPVIEPPPDVHVALYRIAQEALNNVVKHSQTKTVTVALRHTNMNSGTEGIALHISDDGRGFDLAAVPPDRLGLDIIRERAASIGATLKIESQPGMGTRITVLWSVIEDR
jgi:signal transduction histidine kinase